MLIIAMLVTFCLEFKPHYQPLPQFVLLVRSFHIYLTINWITEFVKISFDSARTNFFYSLINKSNTQKEGLPTPARYGRN